LHDGQPTSQGCTEASKVLRPDIHRSVQIGIEAVPACAAQEETLRTTIRPMLIATTGTHLGSVAGVYPFNGYATFLRFVEREAIQLGKAPTVQAALGVSFLACAISDARGVTNVREVLKDNRTARRCILNDALGEDMICIPVEASLPLAQLFQVAFGRLRSVGLEFSANAEGTAIKLFPVLTSQELAFGGNGWPIQAQVNPDDFRALGDNRFRNSNHHMQPEFAFTVDEVSSGNLVPCIVSTEVRYGEGDSQLASTTREPDRLPIPVERIRMHIVANTAGLTMRHLDGLEGGWLFALLLGFGNLLLIVRLVLFLPREGTPESLGGFDTRLNEQVTHQPRARGFCLIVHRMMQLDPVLFAVLPTIGTYLIEGSRELPKRLSQGCCLFGSWMQLYSHRSVHTESIPYMSRKCRYEKGEAWGVLRHAAFPLPLERRESPCRTFYGRSIDMVK